MYQIADNHSMGQIPMAEELLVRLNLTKEMSSKDIVEPTISEVPLQNASTEHSQTEANTPYVPPMNAIDSCVSDQTGASAVETLVVSKESLVTETVSEGITDSPIVISDDGQDEDTHSCRQLYFKAKIAQLESVRDSPSSSWEAFKSTCEQIEKNIPDRYTVLNHCPDFSSGGYVVDGQALEMPLNMSSNGPLYPAVTAADGDCLAHCIEAYTNLTTEEIRVHMTIENTLFEENYLSDSFLRNGRTDMSPSSLPAQYAMYSEHFLSNGPLSDNDIRDIYRKEVKDCISMGVYMGIWQIHSLSSVTGRPIQCMYPNDRGLTIRSDLNRIVVPRNTTYDDQARILWTSTRNSEMQLINWVPNHFVPMLPMAKAYESELCFIDGSQDLRKVTLDVSDISFGPSENSFSSVHVDINKIISALNDSTGSSVTTNTSEQQQNQAMACDSVSEIVCVSPEKKLLRNTMVTQSVCTNIRQ